MAAEMEEEEADKSFRCFVHRFATKLDIYEAYSIHQSVQHQIICIHDLNGELKCINLNNKQTIETFENVKSFLLHNEDEPVSQSINPEFRLCVHNKSNVIAVYLASGNSLKCERQKSIVDLVPTEKGTEAISTCQLVAYSGPHVVLCVDDQFLLSVQETKDSLKLASYIDLPSQHKSYRSFQVILDIAAIYNKTENKISFHSIRDGRILSEVDMGFLSIDLEDVQIWQLSTDLKILIYVFKDCSVLHVDLETLSMMYPDRIKACNTSLDTSVKHQVQNANLNTSKFGDACWRDKLLYLHDCQSLTKSSPWYKRWRLRSTKAERQMSYRHNASVTGFQTKAKRESLSEAKRTPTRLIPQESLAEWSVEEVSIGPNILSLLFRRNRESLLGLCNVNTEHWSLHRFKTGEFILLAQNPSMPHLVATDTHLICILTDGAMDQEHFVSELMVYGGAGIADTLCHLNKWGRCSIPLTTLEVGLKHRQLDTVSFFLKSKEKMFSSCKTAPASPQSLPESPSWNLEYNHHDNISQLEPALNLLLQSTADCMSDRAAQKFSKDLLDITIDFLYSLLLDAMTVSDSLENLSDEKEDLQKAVEKLLMYIEDTRRCMGAVDERYTRSNSVGASSLSVGSLSVGSVSSFSLDVTDGPEESEIQWVGMSSEAIIEDGIMTNRIPEIQKFLLDRGEGVKAGYSSLKETGIRLALNHIKKDNMARAKQIITKLGLNVVNKLWDIVLYTHDTVLREAILTELQTMSALKPDQVAMVTFLHQLTLLYPCRNFEAIRDSHHHVKDSETSEAHRLKQLSVTSPKFDLTSECSSLSIDSTHHTEVKADKKASEELEDSTLSIYDKTDTGGSEESGVEDGGYCEVLLDWIQWWDKDTRDRIQLDKLISSPEPDLSIFSKEIIWKYLLYHNMADVIVAWIQFDHGNSENTREGSTDRLVSSLGPVPADFVNHIDPCPSFTKHRILKAFARQGVFDTDTLSDFKSLLHQLKLIGGVLQVPHPLEKCRSISLEQFHMDLIQHCIHHSLPQFLWSYCTVHRLSPVFLYRLSETFPCNSWFTVFSHFYALTQPATNRALSMYQASLSNAVTVWGKESSSVGGLIQQGHVLAALATLMYSHSPLQQVTFVTQQMEAFDGLPSEVVERAIKPFPKLHTTLFPASVSDSPYSDVSVYDLLMNNSSFDPRRLFGWQSTNTLAGEDSPKQMPYFSNQALVAKYGYSEQLHYPYYLKQGRPSFAFVTFLADEFKNGNPSIPPRRMMTAYSTALWIGVKNFQHPNIAASCVVFQELLGEDSLLLRTYLQVGNEIMSHRNNAVTGTMDKRREQLKKNEEDIVELLLGCVKGRKGYRPVLLQALEAAILASLTREKISLTSFEAAKHWTVAVVLCHLLRLPYTTVFLESCAQTNKWLPFVWFSQLHQYPKEQLQNLLHLFGSHHVKEHLHYVLVNADLRSTQPDKKTVLSQKASDVMGKEVRSTLYSKIGLKKDESSTEEEEESSNLVTALTEKSDTDIDLTLTFEGAASDVFGVVFAAQSSKCEWKSLLAHSIILRNPLFAELAACLKESSLTPCLCSWLVSMMDVTEHAQFLEHHGKMTWRYSLQTLDTILDIYVKRKWGSVLVTGFDIFQPNSPLLPFLQFYAEFTENRNYNMCRLLLDEFKEAVFHFRHDRSSDTEGSSTVSGEETVGDCRWLEQTTYRIIQYLLTSTPSVYQVTQLLKLLDTESITLIFTKEDADFRPQCQMMQFIQAGEIHDVNFTALLTPTSSSQYEVECNNILRQLMSRRQYDEARKFAAVAKIPSDNVTIAQVNCQKQKIAATQIWASNQARLKFYSDTAIIFKKHGVSAVKIIDYYQREVDETDRLREKAYLYQLCLDCVQSEEIQEAVDQSTLTGLFKKLWRCHIQHKVQEQQQEDREKEPDMIDMFDDLEVTNQTTPTQSRAELMFYGKMPDVSSEPDNLRKDEVKALLELIGGMLRQGRISESCRVALEFSVYCQDLAIVLTCIRLSLGVKRVEDLKPDMLHLLRTTPGDSHRMSIAAPVALLRNSSSISLSSNIQPQLDFLSDENEEKIAVMEKLLQHCNQGQHICRRIITAFKIAAVLEMSYDDLVSSDDYDVLRPLLKTHYEQRFRLASNFLSTSALSPAEVAGFLSDAIIQSFQVSLGNAAGSQDMFLDPHENLADFYQIVRLCQEPTLLGNRLLESVAAMAEEKGETSSKVLTLQTELLILSHECYTAACNMEGIANILRAARVLTAYLDTAQEYSLMTRLLTGVGRYNEMIYIFEALQQNHQFELLLGKGMDKETKFRTAILDYLKRYHPTDTDTYTMVALKFMMYREIAQLLQDNANKILNRLKGKPLENNSETSGNLQKAAQFLSEAAESYIKENCLRHAQSCIRQARLVALQIKHLPSNQQFINLTNKGASLLIADHHVFSEAFIISEAYGRRDNWGTALCNNVLIHGDMKYLQEFRAHLRITPALIQEAVDRYQQMAEKPVQGIANVKKLLPYCRDIKLQYAIAKDLGIRDLVTSLEKGDSRSYLQDISSSV